MSCERMSAVEGLPSSHAPCSHRHVENLRHPRPMRAGTSCETHAAHRQAVADPGFKPGNWCVSLPGAYFQFRAQSAGLPSARFNLMASGRHDASEAVSMRRSVQARCGSSWAAWTFRCPCSRPPARPISSSATSPLRPCASCAPWHSIAARLVRAGL